MRFGPHTCLLVLGLLAACAEDVPPAHYEVFTLKLVDLAEGERVVPGTSLAYRIRYVGDLARNLQFTAVLTHEASGETATVRWSESPQDERDPGGRATYARTGRLPAEQRRRG